jgi:hypothetical protein
VRGKKTEDNNSTPGGMEVRYLLLRILIRIVYIDTDTKKKDEDDHKKTVPVQQEGTSSTRGRYIILIEFLNTTPTRGNDNNNSTGRDSNKLKR